MAEDTVADVSKLPSLLSSYSSSWLGQAASPSLSRVSLTCPALVSPLSIWHSDFPIRLIRSRAMTLTLTPCPCRATNFPEMRRPLSLSIGQMSSPSFVFRAFSRHCLVLQPSAFRTYCISSRTVHPFPAARGPQGHLPEPQPLYRNTPMGYLTSSVHLKPQLTHLVLRCPTHSSVAGGSARVQVHTEREGWPRLGSSGVARAVSGGWLRCTFYPSFYPSTCEGTTVAHHMMADIIFSYPQCPAR